MTATTRSATDGASGRDNAALLAGRTLPTRCRPPPTRPDPTAPARRPAGNASPAVVSAITAAAQLTPPMVSHHLQILHRAAPATHTKHGSRVYHQINDYALEVVTRDPTSPQGLAGPSRSPSFCGDGQGRGMGHDLCRWPSDRRGTRVPSRPGSD